MYPAAEDNYGYDACAVLCLPCVPNILVIATETGTLYHCVVLEAEEEEETGVSTVLECNVTEYSDINVLCRIVMIVYPLEQGTCWLYSLHIYLQH